MNLSIKKIVKDIIKYTSNIRHKFIILIIKYLVPSLYKNIDLHWYTKKIVLKRNNKSITSFILFMKKMFGYKLLKGVEVGVLKGINAKNILKTLNMEKLYLVDIWKNYKENDVIRPNINLFYKSVIENFKENKNVEIIKSTSQNAIKYIDDNSLDFVYIDANHLYDYVYQDIQLWYTKVKKNGVIGGHDIFSDVGVLKAVKDFCFYHNIFFYVDLPDWYFVKTKK